MKKKLLHFVKTETVLVVATILAIISMFLVHPSKEYASYIDWRVLGILLTLMLIMEALSQNGFFDSIGESLLSKTKKVWQLVMVLVFLCFFFAMLITNDVALITFVPFAIMMLQKSHKEGLIVPVVILQTLAANLGSMLTPIGNPQNLYLYSVSEYGIGEFILTMLPYTAIAFVLLLVSIMFLKGKSQVILYERGPREKKKSSTRHKIRVYLILFFFALLVVGRIFPWWIVLLATILITFSLQPKVLVKVDYCLLLTFIAFFIFTGNLSHMPAINEWMSSVVSENEFWAGAGLSQVVSNVPATLMLTQFTSEYHALLIAVNIGGMGTLIASMASLISYKLLAIAYPEKRLGYIALFTVINLAYFLVLTGCFFALN